MGHFFNQKFFHPAPMAHDKVFNANPILRGEREGMSDDQTLKVIGSAGLDFSAEHKKVMADRDAAEQQRNAAAEQQRINQAIAELHSAYGIGDDIGSAYNRSALNHQYDQYARDYIGANTDSAQQGFDAQQRQARFSAAASGQSGGSIDANNQYADLQGLIGAQTRIAASARSNVDSLRSQDQAEMLQGQSDILGGTSGDEAILNGLTAHSQQIRNARSQVPYDAVGQLASYGGSLVSQNAQANGFYQGGGYGGGYPSYGMPGDAGYNPYYSQSGRSPGLFGRGGAGSGGSITG